MNDIDINAIRRLDQAATKGPWKVTSNGCIEAPAGFRGRVVASVGAYESGWPSAADAEFIAHARTAVPALLAKADELTAALAERDTQLTAANRRADGLQNDLNSAIKGNTEYAGQVEQLKRAIREALNGVSHVWDAQRIDWVPIAEYAAKKPAEATR